MTLKKGDEIYFMGIAGTGMAAVAGLMQEAGFKIKGSDQAVYPPMSTMLEELKIPVASPYSADNLKNFSSQMIVVANVLSRGHPEVEVMLKEKLPYTSFPQLVGDVFLKDRTSIVVTGTHGKTTTSSIMAHTLRELGEDPSYLIGGVPRNFTKSFHLAKGKSFVIEGDEYDTAFFDKESKFLHYKPKHILFNNIEFDHADIFKDLAAVEAMFEKLLKLAPNPSRIIANIDDLGVTKLLKQMGLFDKVTQVSGEGKNLEADVIVTDLKANAKNHHWNATIKTKAFGDIAIDTVMGGAHNMSNIAQVIATLSSMKKAGHLSKEISASQISQAISSFKGIKRRLDHLASVNGIEIYEDFAHHPTAVEAVINSFRKSHPTKRLVVAFEPRNATARRNVFSKQYAEKLSLADNVVIGKCSVDLRIPEAERMDINVIEKSIGKKAKSFKENEDLLDYLSENLHKNDAVIFMSSGSFSGIQYKLADRLQS